MNKVPTPEDNVLTGFNVRNYGAAGNGVQDDTDAFNAAFADAAKTHGTVFVPDGVYSCADIRIPYGCGLVGNPTWTYRAGGGSVLRLNRADARCLLNITGAVGATLSGLSIEGGKLGKGVHGIFQEGYEGKKEEDAPRIERCRVSGFSGDGIHLDHAWCFSLRNSQCFGNSGDGLWLQGWDGFILDCWFSGNGGAGIGAREHTASVTVTANRIEWNRQGGIVLYGASHYNITGNYVDRSGGPGIALRPRGKENAPCFCHTITGNVIYRSGKPEWAQDKPAEDSCHILLDTAHGVSCVGNSMSIGQDDSGGTNSPDYGIVLRNLQNCVIKDNTMHIGFLKTDILDHGGHKEGVIVKDNIGSIYNPPGDPATTPIWDSGLI